MGGWVEGMGWVTDEEGPRFPVTRHLGLWALYMSGRMSFSLSSGVGEGPLGVCFISVWGWVDGWVVA